MAPGRRTRFVDWAFCLAVLMVGLLCLAAAEFARRHGTTPESSLTVVTGRATNATASSFQGLTTLRFSVEGQTVDYPSNLPGYPRVAEAIRKGQPLTLGVSTQRETLFPHPGWVALYTLAIGGEELLTYQHTVTKGYRASSGPFIIPAVLLFAAGWGLLTCYRNRNLARVSQAEILAGIRDPKRARTAAILTSIAFTAAVMFATLQEDSLATFQKVFGARPLGLSLRLFVGIFIGLLLLPMPLAVWHGFKILFRGLSEGGGLSKFQMIRYVFEVPSRHPDLRVARRIVLGVSGFYAALVVAWILYTESHGL
jgi:hypothetical protein